MAGGRGEIVITVDGEPVASIGPVTPPQRRLTSKEIAVHAALVGALARITSSGDPFDAAELVRDGRR